METLYYSEAEKIAFLVPNYYIDSNSNVVDFLGNLAKHSTELLEACELSGSKYKEIKTHYITSSRRYKYMRAFSIDGIETAPKGSFVITAENDWTMWKWLTN